jgi:hypothetical protein
MTMRKNKVGTPTPGSTKKRGRPPNVIASEVYGRAENFHDILAEVWDRLWPLLSKAQTEGEVTKAFQDGARPYDQDFVPSLSALTLRVLQEAALPKRQEPLQRFLAHSLAGVGVVTPRRARDICAKERAKIERAHHIIRYEFYIECSCGYKGHSKNHACSKCGAKILFPVSIGSLTF